MDRGGATKRLVHEWRALQKQGTTDEHITILEPIDEGDLTAWRAILCPPASGVYGGGCFEIDIRVPDTYPIKPPTMRFRTRIFHPNVHWKTGEICLDVLQAQWSPAWTLHSACTAVLALLDTPEPDSPLNVDAANLLRTGDAVAYRSLCAMYTKVHAAV
ncbi:E2 ubiquitin-protein ligase peroxin 4 [Malassezia pachydermatis]|uniref:Protein peroxin-4-like protein n=1 Tax=Malassezia pachydermatis TaxID=77020 RepID=A0A0M8MWA0_9BASI|nr:protein peroxin-4-like protein [Malassezia pachydermatis]KOS14831.1 protein peroxin-4-like protein [Malassezia pachydermatis]